MFDNLYSISKRPTIGRAVNFVGYGYLAVWNKLITHIPSYSLRHWVAKRLYGVRIGNSNLHAGVRFLSPWNIAVGDNVNIQMDCFLDGRGGIVIGDNVDVTIGVKILTEQHDIQSADYSTVKKSVRIGSNAVIGSFAIIMPGVEIGDGAVVGAGSVVVKPVPPYEFHAGNPAVFRRRREAAISYRLNYKRPFH